jgi:hypothetical protein
MDYKAVSQLIAALILFAHAMTAPQPALIRFQQTDIGRMVTICLDGQKVETTFAGKMHFQDENSGWDSVCADVRSPVTAGQFFQVHPLSSAKYGGYVAKAGNIVAKYFNSAHTPDQCAGLQIAVWKTLEDGPDYPSFLSGKFQVHAGAAAMMFAAQYYQAADEDGNALYLQTLGGGQDGAQGGGGGQSGGGGGGQSQLSSSS